MAEENKLSRPITAWAGLGVGLLGLEFFVTRLVETRQFEFDITAMTFLCLLSVLFTVYELFAVRFARPNAEMWVGIGEMYVPLIGGLLWIHAGVSWQAITATVLMLPILANVAGGVVIQYKRNPRRGNRIIGVLSLWLLTMVGGVLLGTYFMPAVLGGLVMILGTGGLLVFALKGGFRPSLNTAEQAAVSDEPPPTDSESTEPADE